MKIYEIRDITNDEAYYCKGFSDSLDSAKEACLDEGQDFSHDPEDYVVLAVFEHELNKFDVDCEGKKVFEVVYKQELNEEKDEYEWVKEIKEGAK